MHESQPTQPLNPNMIARIPETIGSGLLLLVVFGVLTKLGMDQIIDAYKADLEKLKAKK